MEKKKNECGGCRETVQNSVCLRAQRPHVGVLEALEANSQSRAWVQTEFVTLWNWSEIAKLQSMWPILNAPKINKKLKKQF